MDLLDRLPATFAAMDNGAITADKAEAIRTHTVNLESDLASVVERDLSCVLPQHRLCPSCAMLCGGPSSVATGGFRRPASQGGAAPQDHLPRPRGTGMAGMWCISTATDIARIRAALDTFADASKCPGDERTSDARRVDALVDLCSDALAGSSRPTHGRRRRDRVQVTVPYDALLGRHGVCDLDGYGPIGTAQALSVANDATPAGWSRIH